MIADDENYMLEAMEKFIDWKKMECELVFKANNGRVLLEQVKNNPPDIVITDIKMPLINGIEIAKYIYDNRLPIKVIILSAYADYNKIRIKLISYRPIGVREEYSHYQMPSDEFMNQLSNIFKTHGFENIIII